MSKRNLQQEPVFLGVDTSAYTTSAAVVDKEGRVLADVRRLLDVKKGERGLRQSQALFQHINNLPEVIKETFEAVRREGTENRRIAAVAASTRPRPEEGSYMPVFLGGASMASGIASSLNAAFYEFSHQEGHIAAAAGALDGDETRLAFHLSGGTGEILVIRGCRAEKIAGGTLDLSFGQLLDRTGVALGMSFPCGAEMDQIAMAHRDRIAWRISGRGHRVFENPVLGDIRVRDTYANLSGIETSCQKAAASAEPEVIIPELFFRVSDAIAEMLRAAADRTGLREVILVGGVAASRFLREELQQAAARRNLHIRFGEPALSPDNAVGIARLGMQRYFIDHPE
ncbi:MAG: O-sialoglycoprotein endopeptidase [Firmicutes bacterium]|nr:O-sialoglycoprotein endopeptidase [Bacillota bacterium]